MQYYSYEMFREDMKELVDKIDFNPDGIVAIARGGLTMAHFLGIALDLRRIYTINATSFFNKVQQEIQHCQVSMIQFTLQCENMELKNFIL